jgi:hypothetical protein
VIQKSHIWNQFESLPPGAQRQVADFVAALSARFQRQHERTAHMASPLQQESFVGLWKDREEMADSVAWVRQLREEEWRSE